MPRQMQTLKLKKLEHSPTLNTVIMVEETLKNMENSVMTIAELKRKLPRQVNHNTLLNILDYLDRSGKIYIGTRGITWVQSESTPAFREALARGRRL